MTAVATAPRPANRRANRPAPRAPQLTVVGRSERRRPAGLLAAAAVVLLFTALFMNAVFHSVLVSGQARLDVLDSQVTQAQTGNQVRRLKVAELESPARIVESATAAGMVIPEQTHWIMPESADGRPLSSTSERVAPDPASATAELASGPDRSATAPADR